jgi:RNA polymerase sigma factor (sigma-70 family)
MNTTTLELDSSHYNKDVLLSDNMGLIYSYARRYNYSYFQDIVQDGCIGLLRAVDKYDADRGTKFSTYASFWINQAIQRGYHKLNRSVRVPSTTLECIQKIKKVITQYMTENHRIPTTEEIAEATGIQHGKVEYYQQIEKHTLSLDAMATNEDHAVHYIEDEKALDYQSELEDEGRNEVLQEALNILPSKERYILELSLGYSDGKEVPLAEIGRQLAISRERVRQLREQALARIRKHPIFEKLKSYL